MRRREGSIAGPGVIEVPVFQPWSNRNLFLTLAAPRRFFWMALNLLAYP